MLCSGESVVDAVQPLPPITNPESRSAGNRYSLRLWQGCPPITIPQGKAPAEIVGGVRHELAPVSQKTHNRVTKTQPASEDDASHWVEAHFELSHDSEVSAATTKHPEQIRIFPGIGPQNRTLRGNQGEALDIVAG